MLMGYRISDMSDTDLIDYLFKTCDHEAAELLVENDRLRRENDRLRRERQRLRQTNDEADDE